MTGWSVLQAASAVADVSNDGSVPVTFTTANLTAGTKIIVGVAAGDDGTGVTVASVKDGAGNTWTALGSGEFPNSDGGTWLYALDTPAGDAGTKPVITVTLASTQGCGVAVIVAEVAGLLAGNTTAMIDGTAASVTGSTGTSTGSPSYTTTAANEFLISLYGDYEDNTTTWTNPSGYTGATAGPGASGAAVGINASGDANVELAYKNSSGGAEAGAYGMNTASNFAVVMAAFKLASGGGATTGPPLAPLGQPVAARVRTRPSRGLAQNRPGTRGGTGPAPRALHAPARAPLPARSESGTARGSRGTYGHAGPALRPQPGPARPRTGSWPSLPGRAMAIGPLPAPVTVTPAAPAPLEPRGGPRTAAARTLPPRGRTRGTAGIRAGTGPVLHAVAAPVTARRPRTVPAGRIIRTGITTLAAAPPATPAPLAPRAVPWRPPLRRTPAGRVRGTAGTWNGTGQPAAPLTQPAAVRVTVLRTGHVQASRTKAPAPPAPTAGPQLHPAGTAARPALPAPRQRGYALAMGTLPAPVPTGNGGAAGPAGTITAAAPAGTVTACTGTAGQVIRAARRIPARGTGRGTKAQAPAASTAVTGVTGTITAAAPAGTVTAATAAGGTAIRAPRPAVPRGWSRSSKTAAIASAAVTGVPGQVTAAAPAGTATAVTGSPGRAVRRRPPAPRRGTGRGIFLLAPVPGDVAGTPGLVMVTAPAGTVTAASGTAVAGPAGSVTVTAVTGTVTAVTGTAGRAARSRTLMPRPGRGCGHRGTLGTVIPGAPGRAAVAAPAGTVTAVTGTPGKTARSRTAEPPRRGTGRGRHGTAGTAIAAPAGQITTAGPAGGIAVTVTGTCGLVAVSGPGGYIVQVPWRYTRWRIRPGFACAGPRSHITAGPAGQVTLTAPAGTVTAA